MKEKRIKYLVLFFCIIILFNTNIFSQPENYNIEIVESIPVETMLDNPDIRNTQEVWLDMINSAKTNLDIEQFYITNKKGEPLDTILNAIVAAANRGVKVRIIVDSKMYKTYPEDVSWLEAQSPNIVKHVIDFGKLAGGIQHAKYFIVDNREVFLGSQNFDWRAIKHIHELGLRFKNTDAINVYRGIFNADWNYCEANDGTAWTCPGFTISKNYNMEDDKYGEWITLLPTVSPVSFSHVNAYTDISTLQYIIDNSKREVLLQFLTYNSGTKEGSWNELDSSLIAAASRGVKVKLIVSDWSIGKNQIGCLKNLAGVTNIEVKYSSIPDWSGGYVSFARVEHCKYVVADSVCWVGSANAEKSYFYNTRNVGLVVESHVMAEQVHGIFMKDWNGPYTHYILADGEYTPREHGEK